MLLIVRASAEDTRVSLSGLGAVQSAWVLLLCYGALLGGYGDREMSSFRKRSGKGLCF